MTKDELLERGDETVTLRQIVERFEEVEQEYNGVPWTLKQIYQQIDMLVSEKPCGDCISRQAVLELVADYDLSMGQVVKGIHALPSVTPQPKMGKWIDENKGLFGIYPRCSKCNELYHTKEKYCPNCGTKMESED